MKYRIKEIDGVYFPQRRIFGVWLYYFYKGNIFDKSGFILKEQAIKLIKDKAKKPSKPTKPKITIHKVEL